MKGDPEKQKEVPEAEKKDEEELRRFGSSCTQGTQECTAEESQYAAAATVVATAEAPILIRSSDLTFFKLHQGETRIGRTAEHCDIVVDNRSVSELHCMVVVSARATGSFTALVRDLKSRNGTFVNGQKLQKGESMTIKSGDEISLLPEFRKNAEAKFTYYGIESPKNEFQTKYILPKGDPLGTGASSVVRECIDRSSGKRCAVKIVDKKRFAMCKKAMQGIASEVLILKKLNHPNIVSYIDIFDDPRNMFIVLEL